VLPSGGILPRFGGCHLFSKQELLAKSLDVIDRYRIRRRQLPII